MTNQGEERDTTLDNRSMSERVLDTVAAEEGTRPEAFDDHLYDAIDPDALDQVFRNTSPDVMLEFPFRGHLVTAHGDGTVEVSSVLNS